jgi:hypothetical protein
MSESSSRGGEEATGTNGAVLFDNRDNQRSSNQSVKMSVAGRPRVVAKHQFASESRACRPEPHPSTGAFPFPTPTCPLNRPTRIPRSMRLRPPRQSAHNCRNVVRGPPSTIAHSAGTSCLVAHHRIILFRSSVRGDLRGFLCIVEIRARSLPDAWFGTRLANCRSWRDFPAI